MKSGFENGNQKWLCFLHAKTHNLHIGCTRVPNPVQCADRFNAGAMRSLKRKIILLLLHHPDLAGTDFLGGEGIFPNRSGQDVPVFRAQ